jgi:phage head maturation protease
MKLKSATAQFKAAGDPAGAGSFEALVSVFGTVDSWGDVVRPGAFADTIADWKASGDQLPVLWSHRMDDPMYNIGSVVDIAELAAGDSRMPDWVDPVVRRNGGLWVHGVIDTGADATAVAVQALRLLKARRVTQFSYAYDEVEAGPATLDGADVWELRKLKLYEVSPTQIGANELTELLAAKAAGIVSNGRVALAVIGAANDGGDATDSGPVKSDEEPHGVKSHEEPARLNAASTRLLTDLRLMEFAVTD